MEQRDYEIARKLKEKLSEILPLVDFRIFGSRARGDADEYSDMDIFIEIESVNKVLKDIISDLIWEVGFEYFTVISPLVFTKEEIENSPLKASPIVKNILTEGIRI
jgi:predicted nucleotidyltransferase